MAFEGERLGAYRIVSRLGAGGMAELYLAVREGAAKFQKPVALKLMLPHLTRNAEHVAMFVEEARLVAQIHHPNVVDTEDLIQHGDRFGIVLEYVHGGALSSILPKLASERLRLHPAFAVSVVADAARGLHAAHEARDTNNQLLGVVHQDVSPHNILLCDEGAVKLIDFGIASSRRRIDSSMGRKLRGKLRYMPIEQMKQRELDRRTDVFSLAVVLWEMVTGRRLHGHKSKIAVYDSMKVPLVRPSALVTLSPELDDIIGEAMSHDPDERPSTAREFRERLLEAVPEARRIDPVERAALLMGAYGDELAIRRVQLDLIDQSALSPEEMTTLPPVALRRWTLPSERISINSLFPAPIEKPPEREDSDGEVTEIELDWTRADDDPIATH